MTRLFADKVAVVTGAASGIGRALCDELARHGAIVVVSDIDLQGAERVASALSTSGKRAEAIAANVTDFDSMQSLVNTTLQRHGRIDYLFNNAGMTLVGELRDMTINDWRRILDLNLHGVVHGVQAAYPAMVRQGFGHVINVASGFGLVASPGLAAYCTTKHAVVTLTKALRAEGADLGVRATVACPGFVATPLYDTSPFLKTSWSTLRKMTPVRMLDAQECARTILIGVAKNRVVIAFPGYVRALHWLDRLMPWLWSRIAVLVSRRLRTARS